MTCKLVSPCLALWHLNCATIDPLRLDRRLVEKALPLKFEATLYLKTPGEKIRFHWI